MTAFLNIFPSRLARWLAFTGFAIVALLLVRQVLGSRPWPESEHELLRHAVCTTEGREISNVSTRNDPLVMKAETSATVTGKLSMWDYPFATRRRVSSTFDVGPARMPQFIVVFRQIKVLTNRTPIRYRGRTFGTEENQGEQFEFAHTFETPSAPGMYRLQVLLLEKNPAVLALRPPEDTGRPVGVIAEALVKIE